MTEGNRQNGNGERPFPIAKQLEGGPPSRRAQQGNTDPLRIQPRHKEKITVSKGDIAKWKKKHEAKLPPSFTNKEQKPRAIPQRPQETELDETDFTDDDVPYAVPADEHSDGNAPWAELDDSSPYNLNDKKTGTGSVGNPDLPYLPALVKKDDIPYAEPVDSDPEGIELGEDAPSIREAAIYLKDFFLFNGDQLAAELTEFVIGRERLPNDDEALETIRMMNLPHTPVQPIIQSACKRVITKLQEFMAKTKNELEQEDAERRESIKSTKRKKIGDTDVIPLQTRHTQVDEGIYFMHDPDTEPLEYLDLDTPTNAKQVPSREGQTQIIPRSRRQTDTMEQTEPRTLAELSPGDAVEISGTARRKETPKTPTSAPRRGDTIPYEAVSRTAPPPIPATPKKPETPPQHTQVQAQETPQLPQQKKGFLSRLAESKLVRRVTQGLTVLAVTVGLKKETHDIAPPYAPTHTQTILRSTESENTAERRATETARQVFKNTSRPAESEQTSRAKNKPEPVLRVAEPEDSTTHKNAPEPTPSPPIVVDLRNTSHLSVEEERRLNTFDPSKRSIPKPAPLTGEALKKWHAELAKTLKQAELATLTPEQIATRNQAIDTVLQTDREADEALEVAADLADDDHFDLQQFEKASDTIMKKHARELEQIDMLLRTQGGMNPELSKLLNLFKEEKGKNPAVSHATARRLALGKLSITEQIKAREQARQMLNTTGSPTGIAGDVLESIAK